MTPERYQQAKSAFRLALEFPLHQREHLVQRLLSTDPELLTHVLSLLAADALPTTELDRPAVGTHFRLRARSLSYTATPH